MFEFFLLPENLPFSVALLVMLLIGAVEALGLGIGGADLDAHVDGGDLLGWLGVGTVPLLIVLVVLLALFGLIGIAIQQAAAAIWGTPLTPWLASAAALVGALPLTGVSARGLAHVLPSAETTAISLENLVGRRAEIVVGEARRGSPARGRVRDAYGQVHYVMVEPTNDDETIKAGATALLVGRQGDIFFGLPDVNPLLAPVDDRSALAR